MEAIVEEEGKEERRQREPGGRAAAAPVFVAVLVDRLALRSAG